MVEHSNLTKKLAYICSLILSPLFLFGSVGYPYIMITNDVIYELWPLIILILISIGLAFYCLRVFYLLMRHIKTLNHKFEYDEAGIILYSNSKVSKFDWSKLKNSKGYADCQIFCLIDESGNHLMSVWEYASNYREFREVVAKKLGI